MTCHNKLNNLCHRIISSAGTALDIGSNNSSLCDEIMTLSENIAAREAIIPQIRNIDKQITDLTHEESRIAHEMNVSKNFSLLKDLERISKEIKSLRAEADRLDKQHFALIKESAKLAKALLH